MLSGGAGLNGCANIGFGPEDVWPEGSPYFRLRNVPDEFSGTLRIVPDCRDDDVT